MRTEVSFVAPEGAPEWFLENLQKPGQSIRLAVNGSSMHALEWDSKSPGLPTLILVHGFGAHAHWWSFLAPFFNAEYRVIAIDLPGFGDSAPPLSYTDDCFAQAIIGCIEQLGLASVRIVGHSFGGAQSIRAMGIAPELFRQGIVVDSNVRLPPEPLIRKLSAKGAHKMSDTLEDCISRFRLLPSTHYIPALFQYIAFHSCTLSDKGWHWKSDPNIINVGEIEEPSILEAADVPIDMIYGGKSFLNIENKPSRVMEYFPQAGELVIIPQAGHHIMIEYPLELVARLKALLK